MYPGVWRHGDWIRITPRGGAVIYGRSDSTINRQGVRMGTSEIYRAVATVPEILDALVVDVPRGGGEGELWMGLFVVLRVDAELDEDALDDDADDDAHASTPRPYGRLSIYTLHEDKTREFDRLAERAAEGVRASEPDTLVYVIHVVPKAPMQRIIYEIYRDRGAFLSHERQPHIRQFAADRASCVLATNIIDLRLKYAKVAALGSAPETATVPRPSCAAPRN